MKTVRLLTAFAGFFVWFFAVSCASSELTQAQSDLFAETARPWTPSYPLIAAKAKDVNVTEPVFGYTPLITAILAKSPEKMDTLLRAGAKPDFPDAAGIPPIYYAASMDSPAYVSSLIRAGAAVEVRGTAGKTPLMEAVRNGRLETVKVLLANGADIKALDDDGRNVLIFAAMAPKNQIPMLEFLVAHGAEVVMTKNAGLPIVAAITYKNTDVALFLLKRVGNLDDRKEKTIAGLLAMKAAAFAKNNEVAEALIQAKLPLDSDINYVYKGMNVVNIGGFHKFLAQHSIISDGKFPLIWAAEADNLKLVRLLLKHGANPLRYDNAGLRPYAYAVSKRVGKELENAERQYREKRQQNLINSMKKIDAQTK